MSRFAVFIAVAAGLLAGIHYYLWARLVRDTHLPRPFALAALVGLVALACSVPLVVMLGRTRPGLARLIVWPAYVWMGTMFLLFIALVGTDVIRLVAGGLRRVGGGGPVDPARRTLLARIAAVAVASFAGGLAAVAMRSALGPVAVRRLNVRLPRLPRAQHGFSIVQLTDLHVGPTIGRAFVAEIVRRTNALAPDLVAITGDLVDGSVAQLRDAVAPLGALRARHGVYFVTGNHEYYSGAAEWIDELSRLGIHVLRNQRVSIGDGASSFDLAGVDDRSSSRFGGLEPASALAKALDGRDGKRELVLLAHQPRSFFDAAPLGVGLQLSGHTHGGQLWPFSLIVRLQQPFLAGLHARGDAHLYVSRGTGYWGPPMRLGAPSEITHVVLESAAAA
jgi:predicted MPP superfamily phosphohydrolase